MKQCVLFVSNIFNDESIKRYNYIRNTSNLDVFWCYDNIDVVDSYILNFRKEDLGKKYGRFFYIKDTYLPQVVFIPMFLKEKLMNYDYIWCVENDNIIIGNDWYHFFNNFIESDSDFIASFVQKYDNVFWDGRIKENKWDIDVLKEFDVLMQSFNSIFRVSHKMLEVLNDYYKDKKELFYEIGVATLCVNNGLKIEDFGGNGKYVKPANINSFYKTFSNDNVGTVGRVEYGQKTYEIYKSCYQGMLMHSVKLDIVI